MPKEYIIYCDESEEKGEHFSNFYGGAFVTSDHLIPAVTTLRKCKIEQNLYKEVKWTRITANYERKYIALMDTFFDLVKADKIKIRIMFTQNTIIARGLTKRHVDEKYFILYYMFIKHAFGLNCSPVNADGVELRIYPDQLPATREKVEQFRGYLGALSRTATFRHRRISIKPENISDVDSKQHEILQCLDIVLGAIHFRLNDKHREKTARNGTRRGSRTKAKDRVYKHILKRIQDIYPGFNIGRSTGQPDADSKWKHPYRHWLFTPRERIVMAGSKRKK